MDGGVYNNLPHDLAVSRGYKNIIVVDVSGMGVNRRVNPRGTNTIYVKISAEIGGVMDFDRDTLNQLRTLGYLDTMKTFGRFVGNRYFLDPNEIWERRFTAFLERRLGAEYLDRLDLMKVLPPGLRHERRVLYPLLDSAASALEIERIRSYTYSELCSAIVQAKAEVDRRTEQISSQVERRRFMRTVRRIRRGRRSESELPRSPYYYSQLLGGPSTSAAGTMARRTLRAIYPALIGADFVLPLIEEFTQTTELPNQ